MYERHRGPVHKLVRRVPGVQAAWRELRIRDAMRRGVVTLDYPRAEIRVRAATRSIARLRIYPVRKEPWTVDWIERNLRAGDVLYDLGANVGSYTLIAAKVCPEARIVAVEPGYGNFAALCDNLLLNGVADSVTPLPLVLGAAAGTDTLGYSDVTPGAALHELGGSADGYRQPVLVHALDDLVERFGLDPPTLIKLDVDGAEASVLEGSRETLRRPELRSVIVEIEEAGGQAVVAELDRAGLELQSRFDSRDGVSLPGVWYGIFERP